MDGIIYITGFLTGIGLCIRHVLRASKAAADAGENWYQSQARLSLADNLNNQLAQALERERAAQNKRSSS